MKIVFTKKKVKLENKNKINSSFFAIKYAIFYSIVFNIFFSPIVF